MSKRPLSRREEQRRELIVAFNKGRLSPRDFEAAIFPLYFTRGTHSLNTSLSQSTQDVRRKLFPLSKRYREYLFAEYPRWYAILNMERLENGMLRHISGGNQTLQNANKMTKEKD